MDDTLTGTPTLSQSEPGSNDNERILHTAQFGLCSMSFSVTFPEFLFIMLERKTDRRGPGSNENWRKQETHHHMHFSVIHTTLLFWSWGLTPCQSGYFKPYWLGNSSRWIKTVKDNSKDQWRQLKIDEAGVKKMIICNFITQIMVILLYDLWHDQTTTCWGSKLDEIWSPNNNNNKSMK